MKAWLQPVLFLAAAHFFFRKASCLHFFYFLPRRLSCFSLSIHISRTESFSRLTNLRSSPIGCSIFECPIFRAGPHVRQWSFTGWLACVDLFCFQFNLYSFFRSDAMTIFVELAAGLDLASFRKNVVHSSPRPRCLGCKKECLL